VWGKMFGLKVFRNNDVSNRRKIQTKVAVLEWKGGVKIEGIHRN
jgi:hypothetical protein